MRMSRRMGLYPQKKDEEEYAVRIWDLTGGGDYTQGEYLDGIYGTFAVGDEVTVDLEGDGFISVIVSVSPYSGSGEIEGVVIDYKTASFIMPAFDVAVEVETR